MWEKKIFPFSKYFWQNHQNSSPKKKFTIPIIRNIPIIRQNDGLRVQILTFPGLNIAINNKPDIIKKVKGTKCRCWFTPGHRKAPQGSYKCFFIMLFVISTYDLWETLIHFIFYWPCLLPRQKDIVFSRVFRAKIL